MLQGPLQALLLLLGAAAFLHVIRKAVREQQVQLFGVQLLLGRAAHQNGAGRNGRHRLGGQEVSERYKQQKEVAHYKGSWE